MRRKCNGAKMDTEAAILSSLRSRQEVEERSMRFRHMVEQRCEGDP